MIEIKHGDCLELMKHLADESIDLTVTSPPYDNLRSYNGNIDQWCFEKFQDIAKELYRVTKRGGVVVWIVADATVKGSETGSSFKQVLHFMDCGFNLHDTMIWRKPFCGGIGSMNRYENVFEYMFILSKGSPKHVHIIKDKPNKSFGVIQHGAIRQRDGSMRKTTGYGKRCIAEFGRRHNVWDITPCATPSERLHPAPFPERLATDHILSWSDPGDVVLDPFAGSGTTGIACIATDRQFIGFEICDEYCNIARERIANRQEKASERNPER